MKRYEVIVSPEAERDLIDLFRHVAAHDGIQRAEALIDTLEALCNSLTELPSRGHLPPELERIGVNTYREVHFKPYRVIYQIIGEQVAIHCTIDARRDLQIQLERRLLRS